jgi:uncharacterized MAPEG superfamily protein
MDVDFACVFAAFLLIYLPTIYVARARVATGAYDNHHPREQQAGLDAQGRRAVAAQANSFEAFAPFAAAVVLARLRYTDPTLTHALCLTFIAARVAYPFLYIYDRPTLRSTVWGIGAIATGLIYVLALVP